MAGPSAPGAPGKVAGYTVWCRESAGSDMYRVYGPVADVMQPDGTMVKVIVTRAMAEQYRADRHNPYTGYHFEVREGT